MSQDELVIEVKDVYKEFKLPHERIGSVKNMFTNLIGNIRKSRTYETQHALKNVSFNIKKGEFFGIVGRNGSGKSTMLKMLAGIYQPTKGTINVTGKLVPFIELGVGFNPELTGKENVYLNGAMLGFSKDQVDILYPEIVEFAELEKFMDQKLKNYSSGMQVRLAFSMAIRAEADILLVDEVLAVGDADFQRKCFQYFKLLKKNKKTVVFVSHDMGAIKEFCDRALLIDKNRVIDIGDSQEIAKKYAQLFMQPVANDKQIKNADKRWGTQDAYYTDVKAKIVRDKVLITAKILAKKIVEDVLFGVHIVAQDGKEVTATNNRMINSPDISIIHENQEFIVTWEILNIFSDGKFYVTVTLADAVTTVFDWYQEATSFTVRRHERSTTSVMPPIQIRKEAVK